MSIIPQKKEKKSLISFGYSSYNKPLSIQKKRDIFRAKFCKISDSIVRCQFSNFCIDPTQAQ